MTGITPEVNTTLPAPAASGNGACPFLLPPERPVMKGPAGILWDFNDGARVLLPEGRWRVALLDDDSGNEAAREDIKLPEKKSRTGWRRCGSLRSSLWLRLRLW